MFVFYNSKYFCDCSIFMATIAVFSKLGGNMGMGFFNFLKKKPKPTPPPQDTTSSKVKTTDHKNNSFGEPLDKLVDGDLPWGWSYHNEKFINEIRNEYSYFLNKWANARNSSTQELYSALKSFVQYMEDVDKLCKSKGECFEFWFSEVLTGKGYLEKRKAELQSLESHYDELVALENKKETLSNDLWNYLSDHNGILQKDIYKNFDIALKSDIQQLLYQWDNEHKIRREKKGNTYSITI